MWKRFDSQGKFSWRGKYLCTGMGGRDKSLCTMQLWIRTPNPSWSSSFPAAVLSHFLHQLQTSIYSVFFMLEHFSDHFWKLEVMRGVGSGGPKGVTRWPKATSPPQELEVGTRRAPYLLVIHIRLALIHCISEKEKRMEGLSFHRSDKSTPRGIPASSLKT